MCMSVFTVVNVVFTGKTTLHLKTTATKEKVQFTYVIVVIEYYVPYNNDDDNTNDNKETE